MKIQQIFFKALSLLPPVLSIAACWEVSRLEGANAAAVAVSVGPALVGFSAAVGLAGLTLCLVARSHGSPAAALLAATVLAASPCLLFLARVAYMEFMRTPPTQ
jgi:hypothetical protein